MKSKIKNFLIPFFLMMIFDLGYYFLFNSPNFGSQMNPHLGVLFIGGLFFGPYGCLGAVVGNLISDFVRGYAPGLCITSMIVSFITSYMAYKLWYTRRLNKHSPTKPRLNNTFKIIYLVMLIIFVGLVYSILIYNLIYISYQVDYNWTLHTQLHYFVNYVNFALLFSIFCIILCRFKDFTYTPKISERKYYPRIYTILYYLVIIFVVLNIIFDFIENNPDLEIILSLGLLIPLTLYLSKPITKIDSISYVSIPERILYYYLVLTILVIVFDSIILFTPIMTVLSNLMEYIATNQEYQIMILIIDFIVVLFFVPSLILLRYIEKEIINPIKSFSKIESFITKDEKIESEGLLNVYSEYLTQDDEIGILSRSYSDLINYNNEYIENLESLEAEKQRSIAELKIAHNIQNATLPNESINDEHIIMEGYCKAAKEVGGDFYDYYKIDDENTMIAIGDASGKGIPAAIFTMLTQNSIKLLIKNELNPAAVLDDVNNQICEKNSEMMFITLFLAIYNNKTQKLLYANAGHNPPIIKDNDLYKTLDVESEIVLGVLDEYEYENYEITLDDELLLYTDGITDAQNPNHELYGEERLLDVLNSHKSDDIIKDILTDITGFCKDEEQFDDMTLLTLKVKR